MILASIFGINQDIIEIFNNKKIEIFCKNIVNLALRAGNDIEKTKMYDLVVEIAIPHLKSCFPLIIFPNSYLMI